MKTLLCKIGPLDHQFNVQEDAQMRLSFRQFEYDSEIDDDSLQVFKNNSYLSYKCNQFILYYYFI